MSKSYQSDIEKFQRELDHCRSLAKANKDWLEQNPIIEKQVTFWVEGIRFLISELEIWERFENANKCKETAYKAQRALNRLGELLNQLED